MTGEVNKEYLKSIIFSPGKTGEYALRMVQEAQAEQGEGIKFGFPVIDNRILPLRAGKLLTVWGYTSHWKSHLMDYLALREVRAIQQRQLLDPNRREIVIKVTWEDAIEEDTLNGLAATSGVPVNLMLRGALDAPGWQALEKAAIARQTSPLWMVGHSLIESRVLRRARPRLDMTDIWAAIDLIVNKLSDARQNPTLIVLDYLTRMPPDREARGYQARREVVEWNVNRSKDLGIAFGCPVALGIQVSRKVLSRDEPRPTLEDALESSAIEQTSDTALGLWYPCKTMPGQSLDGIVVTSTMLIMELLKQKGEGAPWMWRLVIDPALGLVTNAFDRPYKSNIPPARRIKSEDDPY